MFNKINDNLNNQLHKGRFGNGRRIDFHDLDLSQAISKKTRFKDELIELIKSLMGDDTKNRYEYETYKLSKRSKKTLYKFDPIRITKNGEAIKGSIDLSGKYVGFREEDTRFFSAHFYTNNSLFINISPLYTLEVDKTDYTIRKILNDEILEEIDFENLRHFTVLGRNSKGDYIYEYRMKNEENNKIKLQKANGELLELNLDSFVNYSRMTLPIHWRDKVRIFEMNDNDNNIHNNGNFVFIIKYRTSDGGSNTKVVSLNVSDGTINELNLTNIFEEIAKNENLPISSFDLEGLKLNKWNQIHILERKTTYKRVGSSTEASNTELYLSKINVSENGSLSFLRKVKKIGVFNDYCNLSNIRTEIGDYLFIKVKSFKNSLKELNGERSYGQNVIGLLSYDNGERFNILSHQNIFVSETNNNRFESLGRGISSTFLTTFVRDHFLTVGDGKLQLLGINLMEKSISGGYASFMNIDFKLFHFRGKIYDTNLQEYKLNRIHNGIFNNALYYSTVGDGVVEVLFDGDVVVLSEEEINQIGNGEDLIVGKKVYVHNEFNLMSGKIEKLYLSYKDGGRYIGRIRSHNELVIEIENNYEDLKLIEKV